MDWKHHLTTLGLALSIGALAWAAPDEEKLGKRLGYPIAKIGNNKDWYYDESVRVGSFTHQAEIPGLYQGKANVLQRSGTPMRLATAPSSFAQGRHPPIWAMAINSGHIQAK